MSDSMTATQGGAPERKSAFGRGVSQGVLGGAGIILGIIGLAMPAAQSTAATSAVPTYLDAIAGLILGLSLMMLGIGLSAAYARLLAQSGSAEDAGGQLGVTTVETFLGAAVIILGVLAILSVAADVLISVQIILVGVGLMLSGTASVRLANLENIASGRPTVQQRIGEELAFATASVRMAAGVAVLVLGILGVIGTEPVKLTLVAMIVGGSSLLLNGSSLGNRIVGTMLR